MQRSPSRFDPKRFQRMRVALGLTQRELARRIDYSAALIQQIETGASRPSLKLLQAIAKVLPVNLDGLYTKNPAAIWP